MGDRLAKRRVVGLCRKLAFRSVDAGLSRNLARVRVSRLLRKLASQSQTAVGGLFSWQTNLLIENRVAGDSGFRDESNCAVVSLLL